MDWNHVIRKMEKKTKFMQKLSITQYNAAFHAILLEFRNTMSECNILLEYLCGLKYHEHQTVMVLSPSDLFTAMICTDNANSAMWFTGVPKSGSGGTVSGRQRQ